VCPEPRRHRVMLTAEGPVLVHSLIEKFCPMVTR
jgi:hypothetical protein